jgi:chemosensory pili system protein ChpA (sensor histidine kinase/response regulator)
MSQDKEREIQMQFLDEANDYFNTLEGVLLEVGGNSRINPDRINGALRAAHSIKGGAAMVGFRELSDLAHRLEDSLKVLKTCKNVEIDQNLQGLLLTGVDWLRKVAQINAQSTPIEEPWLAKYCYPVFTQLHERLGDPTPEDASSMLSPEDDGQNIIPLIFQTEVEGCLERLESVLASNDRPCLKEEVSIMAAELGGLGEMLQLEPFSKLCESVSQELDAAPERAEEIAHLALEAWRRSQALILVNQVECLPSAIELGATGLGTSEQGAGGESSSLPSVSWEQPEPEVVETQSFAFLDAETEEIAAAQISEELTDETEENWLDEVISADFQRLADISAEIESNTGAVTVPAAEAVVADTIDADTIVVDDEPAIEVPFLEPKSTEDVPFIPTAPAAMVREEVPTETTVRVSVKHLQQINDFFGELTIQRNGLNLQVERLRKLIRSLSQRVKTLDRENRELREAYDKIATTGINQVSGISSTSFSTQSARSQPTKGEEQRQGSREQGAGGEASPLLSSPSPLASSLSSSSFALPTFDALEMDRYSEMNLLSQDVMETIVQIQEVTSDIELSLEDTDGIVRQLNKTSKHLQTKLTQVRMRPLSDLTDRFPRALRELSVEYGKNVELRTVGAATLIERNILEALNDPLMHLLRNAFDHGIEDPKTRRAMGKPETGIIEISAEHRSSRTLISIKDDGKGIPLDKIKKRALDMGLDAALLATASEEELLSLIFEPGFSTKDKVTALSGRGVGMDVVRNNLKMVHGDITVDTAPGKGTTFTLSVPFTLSVARVLLVESNKMLLAFPTDVINEIFLLRSEQVFPMGETEVLNWQGSMVHLVRLGRHLEFNCPRPSSVNLETPPTINAAAVLMINQGNQTMALGVDRCWGEQEVAIRRVEGDIPMPPGFGNCTILGDGRVVPLVSVAEILHAIASTERRPRTNLLPQRLTTAFINPPTPAIPIPAPVSEKGTILIVDDSINVRRFLALTLERGGYRVEQAKDGQDALDKLSGGLEVQAVICDIEMPRLDGYGFLARVKGNSSLKRLPVAMLTSRSGDKHRQLAMQLGATAYFSKPYNEQELLHTLEKIILDPLTPALSKN